MAALAIPAGTRPNATGFGITLIGPADTDRALLALQGPEAAKVLAPLVPQVDLSKMVFSNFARTDVNGSPCFVTRTGE